MHFASNLIVCLEEFQKTLKKPSRCWLSRSHPCIWSLFSTLRLLLRLTNKTVLFSKRTLANSQQVSVSSLTQESFSAWNCLNRNPVGPKSLKWWCETDTRNADVSHWINKNTSKQLNQQMYVYTLTASHIPLSSVITSFLLANLPLAAEPFATTHQGRLVHSLNALCAAIALLHHAVRRGREEGQHAEDVTWIC